ncbi:MAG: DUF3943 domain-containing protein [Halobacteriovoraceae bacterium]|nr:DUF3943 domain-containing protein [Halobacteriovoraceae bacterium]
MRPVILLFITVFLLSDKLLAKQNTNYRYTYPERTHEWSENFAHIGVVYLLSWGMYPIVLADDIKTKGSTENYKNNFGKLVFDRDEPYWNWGIHPLSGSMLYLYYRTNGYTRSSSLAMAFVSSTLFEFTVEIYTEPASVQDLYQTPVIGSIVGLSLETLSLYLLNTNTLAGRIFGHILNPFTLFWFYDGKMRLTPAFNGRQKGLIFMAEF